MLQEISSSLLKNLVDFILIILILSNPLFYGSVTVLGYTYIEVVVFLCIFLWLLDMFLQRKFVILKVKLVIPIFLFLFLILLQVILIPKDIFKFISPYTLKFYREFLPFNYSSPFFSLSICRESTLIYFFKSLSYFLVFFLIVNHIQRKDQFKKLYNTIILAGLIITIIAIIQKFKGSRIFKENFPLGIFINRNHLAGYLEMIIPLAFGCFISETKAIFRSYYLIGIFIMSLGIFLTLSRAGLIIYIFSIVMLVSILINKAKYFVDLNLKALIRIMV
ncbi:MAG: hypothetical protein NC903_02355, partial [Candidatus Omnitrophica bacterium]|nr:hypothetical protein [Candidatus Omnitrophota bacterium]